MGAGASSAAAGRAIPNSTSHVAGSQTGDGTALAKDSYAYHRLVQKVHDDAKAEGLTLQRGSTSTGFVGVRQGKPGPGGVQSFEAYHSPKALVHTFLGSFRTPEEAALAHAKAVAKASAGARPPSSPQSNAYVGRSSESAADDLLKIVEQERSSPAQKAFQATNGVRYAR